MFVSGLPGMPYGVWNGSPFLQGNRPQSGILGGSQPAEDLLGRVAENLCGGQEPCASPSERLELKYSAALDMEASSLSDVPTDLLKVYEHMLYLGSRIGQLREQELTEYRDQLSAFDQTIQTYQEMLDGTRARPELVTTDQVRAMLKAAKESRETFLQEGGEEINHWLSRSKSMAEDGWYQRILAVVLGEEAGTAGEEPGAWHVDPNAGDIYQEIDRALGQVRGMMQTYRRGLSTVAAELERRGCADAPYRAYFRQREGQAASRSDSPALYSLLKLTRPWSELCRKSAACSAGQP